MNRMDQNPDAMLDAIIEDVRSAEPEARVVEEAAGRVWARIAAEASSQKTAAPEMIASCTGFQAIFPEYREHSLSTARRLLLEDHLHECVACRKAFYGPDRDAAPIVAMPVRRRVNWNFAKWAAAAVLVIGVGIGSWYTYDNLAPGPSGSRMTVLTANGGVYRLDHGTLVAVSAGTEFGEHDVLRTVGGAHATLRLIDGSVVEAGERAEFSVTAGRRDTSVHLDRGQIIVQAAKRRSGHLYVTSPDSRVAVTGTVFSVNRGLAGSRVSVVEGEVHVEHGNEMNVLHAGDQVATHPSMARTSVLEDIAWSRNYDQYLALLKQFVQIKDKFAQVNLPGLRYGSRLLDSVPEGTEIYVSLPNLGSAIADLQRIVSDQARQSPELQAWMEHQLPQFEKVTQHLTRIGEYLGDEIVFASRPCRNFCGILIAEVTRPGLKEYIDAELAKTGAGPGILGSMKIVFSGNKVIIGEQPELLQAAQSGGSRFAAGPFGQAVSDVYRNGAGLFVAANLEQLVRGEAARPAAFAGLGFDKVRYLVAEQKQVNGKPEYSAVVTFAGNREGMASWLAAPGAMGSLAFVSPDAQLAASFVVKEPAQMLQDVLRILPGGRSQTPAELEQALGVTLEQLASYLGGEIAIAVDGPLVPVPSWKVIAEVHDAAGLQNAIAHAVQAGNIRLRAAGQLDVVLKQETANGRTWYSVQGAFGQKVMEIHYTFVDGYLFAAPSRSLLERSLRDRAAGTTLARSAQFTKLLPRDSRPVFSGMIYQNAGELFRLFSQTAAAARGATPEQQAKADEIAGSLEPVLVCLYGGNDRIEVASQGLAMNLLMQMLAGPLTPGSQRAGIPRTNKTLRAYR